MQKLILLFLCLLLQASCSSEDRNDEQKKPGTEIPGDDGNYPDLPDLNTNVATVKNTIRDMILIYYGAPDRPIKWTEKDFEPNVVHTNANGQKDWLFDGFLFLEFTDSQGYDFMFRFDDSNPAPKYVWKWLLDKHFTAGKAFDALNSCIETQSKTLGAPASKHKVVMGLPHPFVSNVSGTTYWDESKLDFSKQEDQLKACRWYIDKAIALFNAAGFEHLELAGFYWIDESQTKITGDLTRKIGNYIRLQNKSFYWIPYYQAYNYKNWKKSGFDQVYMQPNYYFDTEGKVPANRVALTIQEAKQLEMSVEFEFDGQVVSDASGGFRKRMTTYIDEMEQSGVFDKLPVAYYEGGGTIAMSQSENPKDKTVMDRLAKIIAERRKKDILK